MSNYGQPGSSVPQTSGFPVNSTSTSNSAVHHPHLHHHHPQQQPQQQQQFVQVPQQGGGYNDTSCRMNSSTTPFLTSGNTSLLAVCGDDLYPGSNIKRAPPTSAAIGGGGGGGGGGGMTDLDLLRTSQSSGVPVTQCCGLRCYGCNCSNLTISRIICWSIIVVICVTFVAVMVHVSLIIFTPPKPDTGAYYTGAKR